MKVVVAISALLLLAAMFVLASHTVERIKYQHAPSEAFYKKHDFDNPELDSFKTDDILFTVMVKKSTHDEYSVWLKLYTRHSGKRVKNIRSTIEGRGLNEKASIGENLVIDQHKPNIGLNEKNLKLFQLHKNLLKGAFVDSQDIRLKLFFSTSSQENVEIEYILIQKKEKHTVFPT